jgi:hypothetical protein
MAKEGSLPLLTDIRMPEEVIDWMAVHLVIPVQGACDQQTLLETLAHSVRLCNNIVNTRKT